MRLRTYLVFAALVIGAHAFSQPYFSRIYQGFGLNRATITPDSGLVLVGGGSSIYSGTSLLRVDRYGAALWTKAYTSPQGEPVWISDVAWIGDSSYILVGSTADAFSSSSWMVQQVVGPMGDVLWGGIAVGGAFEETAYWFNRAERAPDGSAVVCGTRLHMNLAGASGPGYAVRVGHEAGSYFTPFASQPSGPGEPIAIIADVAPTSDGGFVSLGYVGSRVIAYRVGASDTVTWSKSMISAGTELRMHAVEGEEGSTYFAIQSPVGQFFWLIRLDPFGNVSWSRKFEMPGDYKPTGLVRFPNGDLWISGDGWLMACSSIGDVLWAREVPYVILDMEGTLEADGVFLMGRDGNNGWLMRTDLTGQVPSCPQPSFIPAVTSGALVFDWHAQPNPWDTLSGYEVNVASGGIPTSQIDCLATAIKPTWTSGQSLRAYPVPFTHLLNVELSVSHDRVELIDSQGAIRRSLRTNNEQSILLAREDLPTGLYLLRAMHANLPVGVQQVIVE